jgi:hypothetical protein
MPAPVARRITNPAPGESSIFTIVEIACPERKTEAVPTRPILKILAAFHVIVSANQCHAIEQQSQMIGKC